MFRIRQVPDEGTPANREAIRQFQAYLRAQFPGITESEVEAVPASLRDPVRYGFRTMLFVAEESGGRVRGGALVKHAPDLAFCYLDYIVVAPGRVGGGVGGALYERVREVAAGLDCIGLFFESLPDDPALSPDPERRRQNAERLRFYERYGARPIANTKYETPFRPEHTDPPYLVIDRLGRDAPPGRDHARRIVRAILERKYGSRCPPGYVAMVLDSIVDDPVRLRPPRYVKAPAPEKQAVPPGARRAPLVVNDRHAIHHVRERGYVEAPVRVKAILDAIEPLGLFERIEPRPWPEEHIRAVHDGRLVDYLRRVCAEVEGGKSVYPYVFPIRNPGRMPKDLSVRAGYWCIDTFTPINPNAWAAARRGVDCTLTAAEQIAEGHRLAYALVRPPGHHAERRAFGGFCYFNNAAIAANWLARFGRVAILDIDYHHGNGQQEIFYGRGDVLTVSIHGHPRFAYPYFTGFREEAGTGEGAGCNLNIPLAEAITPAQYRAALDEALRRIARFGPAYLVVATGFDTAIGDPTGTWPHRPDDFQRIGRTIGEAGFPTLVVQEGGYRTRTLGANAAHYFSGLRAGIGRATPRVPRPPRGAAARRAAAARNGHELRWRIEPTAEDRAAVRRLVAATGFFTPAEVEIAVELVEDRLLKGAGSDYHFVFGDRDGRLAGYACFGPIAGTDGRFDLYWIAVDPELQGNGLGRAVLAEAERRIAAMGGARIYVETSSTDRYAPTRAFYRRNDYAIAAELKDFYRPGDGKVIFDKRLNAPDGASPRSA